MSNTNGLRKHGLGVIAACAMLLAGPAANAAPETFFFVSGELTLQGNVGADVLGTPVTTGLDGLQVTIDRDALQLLSFELTAPGPVTANLAPDDYAGYDTITLADILLSGGPASLTLTDGGPPEIYQYGLSGTTFSALITATGTAPPLVDQPFSAESFGSGTLTLDPLSSELTLRGVTLGVLGPFGDETLPVVLKGDFRFAGVIPEPGGDRLMVIGLVLVALAAIGRRVLSR